MRRYAQRTTRDGIPSDRVVLEELSTSTRTNAVNSLQLVAARRHDSYRMARPSSRALQQSVLLY